jgi:DNA adenine methylase
MSNKSSSTTKKRAKKEPSPAEQAVKGAFKAADPRAVALFLRCLDFNIRLTADRHGRIRRRVPDGALDPEEAERLDALLIAHEPDLVALAIVCHEHPAEACREATRRRQSRLNAVRTRAVNLCSGSPEKRKRSLECQGHFDLPLSYGVLKAGSVELAARFLRDRGVQAPPGIGEPSDEELSALETALERDARDWRREAKKQRQEAEDRAAEEDAELTEAQLEWRDVEAEYNDYWYFPAKDVKLNRWGQDEKTGTYYKPPRWHQDPASDGQLWRLRKLGFEPPPYASKGVCAYAIDQVGRAREERSRGHDDDQDGADDGPTGPHPGPPPTPPDAVPERPPLRNDKPRVGKNTGNFEWYTPVEILEAARTVLGTFDLDPASCEVAQRHVRAAAYFTKEDDGLSKPWAGKVWMNPPFLGGLIGRFTGKLLDHYAAGDVTEAILLVQNSTETKWFQRCLAASSALCLPAQRMHFLDTEGEPTGRPLQGQCLVYFGRQPEAFRAAFAPFGACLPTGGSGGDARRATTAPSPPAAPRAAAGGGCARDLDAKVGRGKVAPVLKWHGSKAGLAKRIVDLMPPHDTYVEPFAGSAAALLAKVPAPVEVLGDRNRDLISFYRIIQDPTTLDAFLRLARGLDLGPGAPPKPGGRDRVKEAFEAAAARLEEPFAEADPIRRALHFFTVCRLSMSGRAKSCAPPSKSRLRRGMDERQSSFLTALDNLPAFAARLADVTLHRTNALKVIAHYDSPGTVFYLDPPYIASTRTSPDVYRHEMDDGAHRRLLKLLPTLRGKVLLSGYPSPLYDASLRGWTRHTLDVANHGASGKEKRRMTECVWRNF